MYKATNNSKVEVATIKDDEVISSSNISTDNYSLNPNESDKGLKRTLKSRHLSVKSCKK
jgi:amino acid permease